LPAIFAQFFASRQSRPILKIFLLSLAKTLGKNDILVQIKQGQEREKSLLITNKEIIDLFF